MGKPPQQGRARAIEALEAYKRTLLQRLERTKRDLEAVDRVTRGLHEIEAEPDAADAATTPGGYPDLPPQKAVQKFFREHPDRAFKPSTLARKLRLLGYEPTTSDKNIFVTQCRTACLRLVDKGILQQTEVGGRAAFRCDGEQRDTEVSGEEEGK